MSSGEELPPLLSCFGKLDRARSIFHQIGDATREFREQKHYEIVRFDNGDDGLDPLLRIQWRIKILNPVPDDWGYLTGDAVNNMRSALDHALAEVARRTLGFTDSDVQQHQLQFPICSDATKFASAAKRLAKVFPQDVIDQLESLQPYNEDPDSSIHNLAMLRDLSNLAMLRDLSNLDKHRQLTVVAHGIFRSSITADPPLEIVEIRERTGPLADGAVLASVKYKRPVEPPEIFLTPEIRHVESLFVPWNEIAHPLAMVLEFMFESALLAVEELTRELMGPMDVLFVTAYMEQEEQRRQALISTVATAEEIEAMPAVDSQDIS